MLCLRVRAQALARGLRAVLIGFRWGSELFFTSSGSALEEMHLIIIIIIIVSTPRQLIVLDYGVNAWIDTSVRAYHHISSTAKTCCKLQPVLPITQDSTKPPPRLCLSHRPSSGTEYRLQTPGRWTLTSYRTLSHVAVFSRLI